MIFGTSKEARRTSTWQTSKGPFALTKPVCLAAKSFANLSSAVELQPRKDHGYTDGPGP